MPWYTIAMHAKLFYLALKSTPALSEIWHELASLYAACHTVLFCGNYPAKKMQIVL